MCIRDRVSSAAAAEEEFPSARRLNRGYGSFRQEDLSGPLKKLLFGEYLLENFSTALAPKKTQGGLAYEIEYILGGKSSDRENLDAVAKRLTLMRFAADYICLQTDGARKAEARAAAGLICAALLIPGAAEALAQLILLVWAYREAMSDVKTLLAGGSVPLVKTKDSWQLPLDMVTGTGSSGEMPALPQAGVSGPPQAQDGKTRPGGMDYKDYLRILLFLEKRETETMRSLDMIESGLKIGKGKSFFRADLCMAKLKLRSTAVLAAGVSYDFPTGFAYR